MVHATLFTKLYLISIYIYKWIKHAWPIWDHPSSLLTDAVNSAGDTGISGCNINCVFVRLIVFNEETT